MRLLTNWRSDVLEALQHAGRSIGVTVDSLQEVRVGGEDAIGCLVFLYGSPSLAARQVQFLRASGTPVAVWHVDDPSYFHSEYREFVIAAASNCSVLFAHTKQLAAIYSGLGIEVTYLPTAAKVVPLYEGLIAPPLPDRALERDYLLLGKRTQERQEFFREISALIGPEFKGDFVCGVDRYEALRLYRTSRITVSFGSMADSQEARCWGVTERTWDVPIVGGFLLQEPRRHLEEHFDLATEAATFEDLPDCAAKARWFLQHASQRCELAKRAQQRVLREHLLQHRLRVIVDALIEAGRAPPKESPGPWTASIPSREKQR